MSKRNKNEHGFTAVEVVLVLVVFAAIIMAGYLAAKHISNENSATPSTNKPVTSSTQTTSTTQQSQKYLVISQFGIEIPLASNISDLSYTWDGMGAQLGSAALQTYVEQQNPSSCSPSSSDTSSTYNLGYISKTVPPGDGSSGPESVNPQVTINGMTYYFQGPQNGCGDSQTQGGINAQNQISTVQQAIIKAFVDAKAK